VKLKVIAGLILLSFFVFMKTFLEEGFKNRDGALMPLRGTFFLLPASQLIESFQKEYICMINRERNSRQKKKI